MPPSVERARRNSEEACCDYFKLDSNALNKQPEEVFDIVGKLGEGSYGSVHKAIHRESGHTLAVKKVPVDTDLQEIIKEISIMQQCDSKYVVKYYGSYFKNSDLWIVMEYCGAGSVSDIMQTQSKGCVTFTTSRKIHRDIKAGNILLNTEGHAKLADFGVAGQLTDTMAKKEHRNWNAILDGSRTIEMAEGRPPYSDIHPMRAIFMIPTKPPPSFKKSEEWSPEFNDFIRQCLVKKADERKTASQLVEHKFIAEAPGSEVLQAMIRDAQEIQAASQNALAISASITEATMVDGGTTIIDGQYDATLIHNESYITAQSLKSQMESLRIGGEIPASAMSSSRIAPPPYENAQAAGIAALQGNANAFNNVGTGPNFAVGAEGDADSTFSSASQLNTEAEYENRFQRAMVDGDYEFLRSITLDELIKRKENLDFEMDQELTELQRRYQTKRQPILDVIETKKRQMF
ncbi:unnamed protein product [Caenorhabditis auriculariae]|uniref:non-specific serine/threonine protein kinase n=1 Tax=Caenorhabditis auriculariae TaxID=2777116 RepID=A0A8S1H603_9PELO|nr:unnamed protein product [Caenorhabditis auriculariae]